MKQNGTLASSSRDIHNKTQSSKDSCDDFYKTMSIVSCNLQRQAKQIKKSAKALRKGAKDLREKIAIPYRKRVSGKGRGFNGDLVGRFASITESAERAAAINIMIAGDVINNIHPRK